MQSIDWQTWLREYWLVGSCALAQLVTFIVYWRDKRLAIKDKPRTPEATLLWWTLIGGLGAAGGIWVVRHKSKKWTYLWRAILLMILSTTTWAILFIGPMVTWHYFIKLIAP